MNRIKLSILFIFLCAFYVSAQEKQPNKQEKQPNKYVKTWRLIDNFSTVDSIPVDTVPLDFQNFNFIDKFSIANSYNGNLGSPIQSKIYFDRPENTDFIFYNSYYPYINQIYNNTFYNTKTPLSILKYLTGGSTYRKQDNVAFLFTANANKKLNFGINLDYIYSIGEYNNQSAKRFSGSLFGSYSGKHYTAYGLLTTNNMLNYENGGLTSSEYITNPPYAYTPATYSVNFESPVESGFKYTQFFYNQQYSVGFERPVKDSVDTAKTEFVPVTRFAHTLKIDDMSKRYFENTTISDYYKNIYYDSIQTSDTAALFSITNRFSVSLAEEFNRLMHFGLTAYIENEVQDFVYRKDTVMYYDWKSNTKVGAMLSKELGQQFTYRFLGQIDVLGYKIGDFLLDAKMGGKFYLWKHEVALEADGYIRSDEPSYFLQNYWSNHFQWNNHFSKIYKTHIGGQLSVPESHFKLKVGVENLTKTVFFDSLALPSQYNGNVQVVALNLRKDFYFGKFALENNVVLQASSNEYVLPLPGVTLYNNLFYIDKWFHVLNVQIGTEMRYNTAYYAPAYMPATEQFYSQEKMLVGNFPIINVYANFHLKRARFYFEYYHINQLFMNDIYYSMPYYPYDPMIFKMGIDWNFYN